MSKGLVPLTCSYVTSREAAAETNAAAVASGYGGLHAMPFNRFSPESSTWWLSPSIDNPAYRHGKIIFMQTDEAESAAPLFVGFYVEKGVGPAGAPVYRETARGRRGVMDSTWLWDRFLGAFGSGEIEAILSAIESTTARPVEIELDAALVPPPAGGEDDVHSPQLPRDVVRFQFARSELQWVGADLPADLLGGLGKPETLPALATRVGSLSQLDWMWIDFQAGYRFVRGGRSGGAELWTAQEIWRKICWPWRAWLQ